jgi:hypothetical protein
VVDTERISGNAATIDAAASFGGYAAGCLIHLFHVSYQWGQ